MQIWSKKFTVQKVVRFNTRLDCDRNIVWDGPVL